MSEIEQYRQYVEQRLRELTLFLQKYAMGDFTASLEIPENEDEFTELMVGISLMVDDFREMMREKEDSIKKLQQAEKSLAEEHALLRTLIDNMPDPIYVKDEESRFLLANKDVAKLMGTTPDDAIGKTDYDFFPSELATEYYSDEQEIIKSGKPVIGKEEQTKRPAGELYWQITTKVPFYDPLGNIKGIVGVGRDISDQKRYEQRLNALNQLNEALIGPGNLEEKMNHVTNGVVEILDADFARVWIIQDGDLCQSGCMHAENTEGPHACRNHTQCLRLVASSGRYTHLDGEVHRRVPFGIYKIGRVASGEEPGFLTNDVTNDPRVHNHEWARKLGLTSFAGYQLQNQDGLPSGVLAVFSKHTLSASDESLLETIARTATVSIQAWSSMNVLREHAQKLEETNKQLETFNRIAIGREQRMIELKRQVNQLSKRLGEKKPYDISFVDELEKKS